jgi:hypothetical protein
MEILRSRSNEYFNCEEPIPQRECLFNLLKLLVEGDKLRLMDMTSIISVLGVDHGNQVRYLCHVILIFNCNMLFRGKPRR